MGGTVKCVRETPRIPHNGVIWCKTHKNKNARGFFPAGSTSDVCLYITRLRALKKQRKERSA